MSSFLPIDSFSDVIEASKINSLSDISKINRKNLVNIEQNTELFKQIVLNENEHIIKIKTFGGAKIYLKYKQGTKTFADIKNFLFDYIKYSCTGYCDKNKFTFEFNDTVLTDIITSDLKTIEESKEGSLLLDTLAKANIPLQLIFNKNNFSQTDPLYLYLNSQKPSAKQIAEAKSKFGDQFKTLLDIKTLNGKTLSFYYDKLQVTTEDIKTMIYLKEEIPLDQQRLIVNGKQLDDKKLLSQYIGDVDFVNIHLVLRLRGGMFSEVSGRDGTYRPLTDLYYDLDGVNEKQNKSVSKSSKQIQCMSISDLTCKQYSSDRIVIDLTEDSDTTEVDAESDLEVSINVEDDKLYKTTIDNKEYYITRINYDETLIYQEDKHGHIGMPVGIYKHGEPYFYKKAVEEQVVVKEEEEEEEDTVSIKEETSTTKNIKTIKHTKKSNLVKQYKDLITNDQNSSLSDDLNELMDELDNDINKLLKQTSSITKIIKKNKSNVI